MRPADEGGDDTVRVVRKSQRTRAVWPLVAGGVAGLALLGAVALWLLWPGAAPVPPQVATVPPSASAPVASQPAFHITTATEAAIAEHVPSGLSVFRFADNPQILVLDFTSLREQGRMLNRVAAFTEKAGLPRDRVLTDEELAAAIHAQGDTMETYYLGHDYSAAGLTRFFALADAQRLELNASEEMLRALLRQEGWLSPGVRAGVISVPAVGADARITEAARASILRHELSHGEFFSNPTYAEYVRNFWLKELSGEERAGVRSFLGKESYDVREEELMYNEMQAYLMFTRDPLFFRPELAGLTRARLAELQARFLVDMPGGWLRDVMAAYGKGDR